jgi:hypothetical protein
MTRHFLFIRVLIAVSISQSTSQNQTDSLFSLLPKDSITTGWSRVDTARIYRGEELFHLIDGGADLFFEYGFRQVMAVEYQNAGGESINLEIYEMNDPSAAYGIYSIRIADGATPISIGQEGSAHPYYIMLWKGKYYVSVAGSDSTQECRKGLEVIARGVDQNIPGRGQRPSIVELLPKEGLLTRKYFRGYLGVSTIRVFDEKDIFRSAEGAIGIYEDRTMLVLRYGNTAEAEQRLAEIKEYLKSNKRFQNYKHQDQISTAIDSKHRYLSFGQSGIYLVVAVSSVDSISQASCRGATLLLGTR